MCPQFERYIQLRQDFNTKIGVVYGHNLKGICNKESDSNSKPIVVYGNNLKETNPYI